MRIKQKILNEYVVLDIETNGLCPVADKIIEVAVCKIKDGNIVDEYTAFINPHQPLRHSTTEITGITEDMLKKAEKIYMVMPKLLEFIGELPIVVHSSNFVMRFIKRNCSMLGLSLDNEVIDTLPLCKKKLPNLENYTIKTISKFLVNNEVEINSLMDYARLTFKVYEKIK